MDPTRQYKILQHIDVENSRGLEIGPLASPIVTREMGDIFYVDRTSTEGLLAWYKNNEVLDQSKIVTVDFVWCETSLRESVGQENMFDYCVASHVIEHVPDMVTWLGEIEEVLVDGGVVSLAIPDKRFTFDRLRQLTDIADLVEAHLLRLRRPSLRQIYDHFANFTEVDVGAAWSGELDDGNLAPAHGSRFALDTCRRVIEEDRYMDAHCWVFTPRSFLDTLRTLSELGLLNFEVAGFVDTAPGTLEFFVALRKHPVGLSPDEKHAALLSSLALLEAAEDLESMRS